MTQPRSESGRRIGTACSVVLGSAAIFCAGVAGFVVIERATFLTGPKQMAFFLLLPVLVGAAALAALRLPAEHKLRLVMALTSTVFSLLVAEFTLLALESYRAWANRAAIAAANEEVKQTAKDYDTRSFPQFFLSHWNEGTKLYPRIYQLSSRTVSVAGERVFPTSNLSNQRIVECFSDGRYKVYTSDEYGFTNPPGLQGKHAKVVLVGDSFTAGDCVSTEEDVGARVRAVVPASVNLGICGAGPFWELANLIEYGLPLDPEYVFWLYYEGNDLADLMQESQYPELTRYLSSDEHKLSTNKAAVDEQVELLQRTEIEGLATAKPKDDSGRQARAEILRSFKLPRIRMRLGLHRDTKREVQHRIDLLAKVIVRAKTAVERAGGHFIFVYVPDYSRFVGGSENFDRSRIVEMLNRNDVRWLDLLPELAKHPDVLSLYPHRRMSHFNAAGYAFVAQRLIAEIGPE